MERLWNDESIQYSKKCREYNTGHPPDFPSPDSLWQAFRRYANSVYDNPIIEQVFVGKNAEEREKPHTRPLSWIGFCAYNAVAENFYSVQKKFHLQKNDELTKDFIKVLSHINTIMRMQRSEGVSCGFYHPRTAADVNFKDEEETTQEGFNLDLKVVSYVRTKDDPTHITSSDSEF